MSLTPREKQVLECRAKGGINKTIGDELGISKRTVDIHSARIKEKLGASTIAHAVAIAIRVGIIQ